MRECYRRYQKLAYGSSPGSRDRSRQRLLMVPLPYFADLGLVGTHLLAQLMKIQDEDYPNAENTSSGWFYLSITEMQDKMDLTVGKQTRLLNKLESCGYIDRKIVGNRPPLRYIRINYDRVLRGLDVLSDCS